MADSRDPLPDADRKGNSMLVPVGIVVICGIIVGLMLMRMGSDSSPPPAPPAKKTGVNLIAPA
jgi:hypothetical protein